jgi:hypothetical protein
MSYMNRRGAISRDEAQNGLTMDWDETTSSSPRPKRDWKRAVLVFGLGLLSWVATYVGLLELIEANMGDLPLLHKVIIGFSVAMLMVMVVWLLDQIFSDIAWTTRLIYVGGYVFLTLISVGFGFGFYWKVLESRGESSRSAEAAVGQVQNALHAAVTRLEQLQSTLDSLNLLSTQKAELERTSGTSCPNSRPGDGPRRQLRDDDAARFKFSADFVKGRVGSVKSELAALNGDLAKVVSADQSTFDAATGTRNEFMRGLNRRLDMTVTGFNAFRSDPQLRQMRADLNDRADRTTFPDSKGGTFACPDSQLATALRGVVRAIDELPVVSKPKIAAVEGSEAVVEAFRRLGATFYGAVSFRLPPSPEELRELQKKAIQSVENSASLQARPSFSTDGAGLSRRDYIPLSIALFVDLCLLLVSIKRPVSPLDRLVPKMRDAEQGPVIQILSRFNEIHRDKEIRENFEVFRHVVFDFHGDYYAAVPLNTPYRPNPRNDRQRQGYGVSDAEQLLQEAHLLSNLFASFEKERIFTRVLSPLLSTGTIQKRLRRQGSKFANAEAFRVYRFRDGAWSEIILGAVMGAAKRVEAEKRRRRVEDRIFSEMRGPTLHPHPPVHGRMAGGPLGETSRPATRGEPDDPQSLSPATDAMAGEAASRHHPQAAAPANDRVRSATGYASPAHANSNTEPPARPSSQPRPENVVIHPAMSRPVQQSGPERGAELSPMRPNVPPLTGTAAEASVEARDDAEPTRQATGPATPAEPTVTVSATRESISYKLPMSEARLPMSLAGSGRRAVVAENIVAADADTPSAPSLPPPLPAAPASATGETSPAAADTHQSPGPAAISHDRQPSENPREAPVDDVQTLARRFGPVVREG